MSDKRNFVNACDLIEKMLRRDGVDTTDASAVTSALAPLVTNVDFEHYAPVVENIAYQGQLSMLMHNIRESVRIRELEQMLEEARRKQG